MEISLTDFVEFTFRSGPSKVTKVREVKNRDVYEPATDFWRPLRDGIVDLHRDGRVDKRGLDAIVAAQTHALKLRLYPLAADGYLSFLGRRQPEWFTPPRGIWRSGGLEVRVNPEVGLIIGDHPTVIKLYFKKEELTQARVQASIGVMLDELAPRTDAGTQFGVLDVRAGRLLKSDGRWTMSDTQLLIRGEARSFVEIWEGL